MSESRLAAVVVLAAGEGTRMRSTTPKVLHEMLGRSLVGHVLTAARPLAPDRTLVVVGHGREQVIDHLASVAPEAEPVTQAEQHGTGHAVRIALDAQPGLDGTVIVLSGDTPLLTSTTLTELLRVHSDQQAAATVLTAHVPDVRGYGRLIRDENGAVMAIVEHRDLDINQRQIDEINAGIYAFDVAQLRDALGELDRDNSQGEEYLTDVIALLRRTRARVAAHVADDHREVLGVNDHAQLAAARGFLRDRVNDAWMVAGVSIVDPTNTMIGVDVTLEPASVVYPWTLLEGTTSVGAGAQVGPGSQLVDTTVGADAVVRYTTADRAEIGARAVVGPYTYLRPGTVLAADTKAGAFVEIKSSHVGEGSKVPHLSYVGDAQIGEGSNIGAATIFVNYDGVQKHRTVIGDQVRIGSDTMLVAPVEVGDGAYTAAGSVITEDVPPGAMGVGRAKQRTIAGWVARKRPGSKSAAAAAAERVSDPPSDSDSSTHDNDSAARTRSDREGQPND